MKLDKQTKLMEKLYSTIPLEAIALRTKLPLETVQQFHERYQVLKTRITQMCRRVKPKQCIVMGVLGPENEQDRLMVDLPLESEKDKRYILSDFERSLEHYNNGTIKNLKLKPNFWGKTLMIHSQTLESFVFLRTYREEVLDPLI